MILNPVHPQDPTEPRMLYTLATVGIHKDTTFIPYVTDIEDHMVNLEEAYGPDYATNQLH